MTPAAMTFKAKCLECPWGCKSYRASLLTVAVHAHEDSTKHRVIRKE